MIETSARAIFEKHLIKAVGSLLLVAGLTVLVGCQGFSTGGSGQKQASTLSLSIVTSTLDFGSVAAGNSKTLTVTASNSGPEPVAVASAAISTKYFSLVSPGLPISVAAGQSTTFSIKFIPDNAGVFNATLSITSDASNAVLNISLSGTAVGTSAGQLTLNPTSEDFGSVTIGAKQSQAVTLTNIGGSIATISQASVSGAGFQISGLTLPLTLDPSQSTTFTVSFAPQASGSASGTVTIISDASNSSFSSPLAGTGVALGTLGSNPTSLNFGSVTIGKKQALTGMVTNTGGSNVTISKVGISGTGFSLSGITTPLTLGAGQSTTFTATFTPQTTATASGSVTITSNASNLTLNIPLVGTGLALGALNSTPSSLSFGKVTVGSKLALSETLTNTGGSSVTISQASITGTGFSLEGIATPLTLPSGQSTTFTVTFTPLSAADSGGNVTITSTASNPILTVPISGTGVTQGTLRSNPTTLSFGNVTVGSTQSLSETVTNTGGSSATISQVSVTGTGFSLSGITTPLTLVAGQSTTFTVTFTPQSAASINGNITVKSNASNPSLIIGLTGTGVSQGTLGSNPTILNFGNVPVGSNQSLSETITNSGGSSATISHVSISGTGFSLSGITTPLTLTSGQSATFNVTFAPQSAASASGSVTVSSNASNPALTIGLSGTGTAAVGQLTVAPATLALGNVGIGNSGTASGTLTATGANVTVTAASTNNSVFNLGGLSLPMTIQAGHNVSFTVTFSPQVAGAASSVLTLTSDAQPKTTTESLVGTGTKPHMVSLSWNASTSSDVTGYNVYRAPFVTSCGAYAKMNPSLEASTAFTDTTIVSGSSYCYASTAIDSNNQESAYSNIVSDVKIPSP